MKKLICVVTTVWLASAALGQSAEKAPAKDHRQASGQRSIAALLETRAAEVIFEGAPFEQVMDWVAETAKLNIWVRWETLEDAGVERDKPITLKARNLRLSQILWMILSEAGGTSAKLGYAASGDVILVSTRDDLSSELTTRVYNVRDILARVPRFHGGPRIDPTQALRSISQGSNTGSSQSSFTSNEPGEESEVSDGDEMQRLITLIQTTIEPETWVPGSGLGTIMGWRGQIVVRNSLYVHQLLGGALKDIGAR